MVFESYYLLLNKFAELLLNFFVICLINKCYVVSVLSLKVRKTMANKKQAHTISFTHEIAFLEADR